MYTVYKKKYRSSHTQMAATVRQHSFWATLEPKSSHQIYSTRPWMKCAIRVLKARLRHVIHVKC